MPTPTGPVRVAVINDYEVVVAGVAAVLRPYGDQVEVVELDSNLPVVSDVDVALYDSFGQAQGPEVEPATLLAPGNATKVVLFSWNVDPDTVRRTLDAGFHGYVSKSATGAELADALRRVHAGERVTPPSEPAGDAGRPPADAFGRWPGQDAGLSARESEVVALICQGLSNDEIAARTYLGVNTVKTYIRTAYRKMGVDSRTKAVLWGLAHGLERDRTRSFSD